MPTLSPSQRYQVLHRDGHACFYCGAKAPKALLTVDHIRPRARGGTNHDYNLVTACSECNIGKSDSEHPFTPQGKYSFSARESAAFMLGRNLALGVPCSQAVYRTFHGMAGVEEVCGVMRAADGFSR